MVYDQKLIVFPLKALGAFTLLSSRVHDYEIDEESWGKKKKPYRYRWPDAVHDEVLARLLELNRARHQEEVAAGLHGELDKPSPAAPAKPAAKPSRKPKKSKPKSKTPASQRTLDLSSSDDEQP